MPTGQGARGRIGAAARKRGMRRLNRRDEAQMREHGQLDADSSGKVRTLVFDPETGLHYLLDTVSEAMLNDVILETYRPKEGR